MKLGLAAVVVALVWAGSVGAVGDETRGEVKETIKENRLLLKEAVRQSKEEFKEKLGEIRDEKKRKLVERLSDRMCTINKNRTASMIKHLETMGKIVDRVEEKAKKAEARGVNVAGVYEAISSARTDIAEAVAAVNAQVGKPCEITVSGDEAALRAEAAAARTALESGLKAAHDKVKEARQAVGEAIAALAKDLGEPTPKPVVETN